MWALEKADTGRRVVMVCSGDAGVYGMASPLLELAEAYPDVAVEVVPGLTAALSGGAVRGAPLAHDFCVISLSDRLTPVSYTHLHRQRKSARMTVLLKLAFFQAFCFHSSSILRLSLIHICPAA